MKFYSVFFLSALFLSGCTSERSPYWGQELAEFRVSSPSIQESRVLGFDEQGLENKRNFMFQACLSDLSGSPLPPGLYFDIQFGSGEKVTEKTDINSCIEWEREVGYSLRDSEKYYLIKTSFISKNKLKGTLTVDLLINPVKSKVDDLRNRKASQMRDVVLTEPGQDRLNIADLSGTSTAQPTLGLKRSNVHTPSTNLTEFQVTTTGVTIEKRRLDISQPYSIDQDLNLYTHNDFRISASPQFLVKRFDNQVTKLSPDRGDYTITVAFLSEPDFKIEELWKKIEAAKTIDDVKQVRELSKKGVEFKLNVDRLTNLRPEVIRRGLSFSDKRILMTRLMMPYIHQTVQTKATMTPDFGLNADINIPLKQDSLFRKRAMVAITIEPHFNDPKIQIKTDGAGFINNMFAPSGITSFLPLPIEADLLHREFEQIKAQAKNIKPLDRFKKLSAAENTYLEIGKKDQAIQKMTESFLKNTITRASKREYLKQVCRSMLAQSKKIPNSETQASFGIANCQNAESALNLQILDFVEDLASPEAQLIAPVVAQKLSISQNFSKSSSASQSNSAGVGFDIGLGFGLPDSFSPLSGGFKASAGSSFTVTRSRTGSTSASLSSDFTLNIEPSQFELQLNTRRCVVIDASSQFTNNVKNYGLELPQGALLCSSEVNKQSVAEKFYFISQSCSDTAIVDCSDDQVSRFNIIVRGEKVYKKFQEMVTNSDIETTLIELPEDLVRKQILKWSPNLKVNLTNQVYPGAIAR